MFASIPHHIILVDFSGLVNISESDSESPEKITEAIYNTLSMCQNCTEVTLRELPHADLNCLNSCKSVSETARAYFTFNPKRLVNVFVKGTYLKVGTINFLNPFSSYFGLNRC